MERSLGRRLYRAATFRLLLDTLESDFARRDDTESIVQGLREWWSEEKEVHEGVLAFHVSIVKE